MATVPNRYYNNPWIGQAAANFTDALFGSPERDLARLQQQNIETQMRRQEEADALTREERGRKRRGDVLLSKIVAPGLDDPEIQAAMQAAIAEGVDPTQAMTAGGTVNPKFRATQTLQAEKLAAMQDAADEKYRSMFDALQTRIASSETMANNKNELQRQLQEAEARLALKIQQMKGDQSEAHDNRTAAGRTKMNRKDSFILDAAIDEVASQLRIQLDPELKTKIRAVGLSKNLTVDEAFEEVLKGAERVKGESTWFGFGTPEPDTVKLKTPPATLSDVFSSELYPDQGLPAGGGVRLPQAATQVAAQPGAQGIASNEAPLGSYENPIPVDSPEEADQLTPGTWIIFGERRGRVPQPQP